MENHLSQFPEYRETCKRKNFDFKQKKDNTIHSLKEVENFLKHIDKVLNYIKLYHLLK